MVLGSVGWKNGEIIDTLTSKFMKINGAQKQIMQLTHVDNSCLRRDEDDIKDEAAQ
ncbi:hypothetical protein GCM10023238_05420 [Streptomyces heliomycini]